MFLCEPTCQAWPLYSVWARTPVAAVYISRDGDLSPRAVIIVTSSASAIMQVSYAHKLSPEAELAAAFPEPVKRSSADGGASSSGGDSGATEQPQQQPAGSAADAETLRQQYAPEAAAAVGTASGAAGAAAADAGSSSQAAGSGGQSAARILQQLGRFQRWSGRSAAAQQLHAERQTARLERRAQELGMAGQRRAEPEVGFILDASPGRHYRTASRIHCCIGGTLAQQLHAQRQAARLERRAQELGMAGQRLAEPEVGLIPDALPNELCHLQELFRDNA